MKAIKILSLAVIAATLGACAHKNPAPVAPSTTTSTGYVTGGK